MGNKTAPFGYLGHPVPLFRGEFGYRDSYVSKGGPYGGLGTLTFRSFMDLKVGAGQSMR
ncbi:MAG: hypothetical protein VX399_00925 [SAR324 cluster bacterium]|nr:hypothetical protein [SAR324 cluster bacterium]